MKHDAKYDFLKFILSIFVLAIHTQLYKNVLYPWVRIAVPLFFIMSSYFAFLRMKDLKYEKENKIIRRIVFRNIKLYVFWLVVLLPITLYIRRSTYITGNVWTSIGIFLRSIFLGSTFVASWYIMAFVFGLIIIFYISKKLDSKYVLCISLLAFGFATFRSSYAPFFDRYGVNEFFYYYELMLGKPECSFLIALIWIYIGKCFAENKIIIKSFEVASIIFFISCGVLFLEWKFVNYFTSAIDNDSYFMLLPTCISFFCCIQKIRPIELKCSKFFRRASTIIYVTHGSIMHIVGFLYRRILNINSSLLVFFTTLFFSIFIYFIIECIRRHFPESKMTKLLKWAY